MSTLSDVLCSIEQRAERAIVQELRQMTQQILGMRATLVANDRDHADALLLKIDRIIDEQRTLGTEPSELASPMLPFPPLPGIDNLLPQARRQYTVRLFSREYGDLEGVAVVESFPLAVQLAVERVVCRPSDETEARWSHGQGTLTVRTRHGTVLVQIDVADSPAPIVQPRVAHACRALESGECASVHRLFVGLRQVA